MTQPPGAWSDLRTLCPFGHLSATAFWQLLRRDEITMIPLSTDPYLGVGEPLFGTPRGGGGTPKEPQNVRNFGG